MNDAVEAGDNVLQCVFELGLVRLSQQVKDNVTGVLEFATETLPQNFAWKGL